MIGQQESEKKIQRRILKYSIAALMLFGMTPPVAGAAAPGTEEVREAVETALLDFPPTAAVEPELTISGGTLTIRGTVDSLPVKNLVSETAATIRGVKSIVNLLEVREVERKDDEMAYDLERLFALNYPNEDRAIGFRVNDGVVTLTGTVSTFGVKRLAETMASSIRGVRSVVNLLRITPLDVPDDDEIRQHLALRLKSNPWVDQKLVKITVKDGVVTLNGAVDSLSEKTRLVGQAEIYGGHTIEDENLVVSSELKAKMERPHRPFFRTDDELKWSLAEAFYQDPRLERSDVTIDILDGNISLIGAVDSIGAKSAAEMVASDLPGGGQVYSFLTIQPDRDISDGDLENSLKRIYASDALLIGADLKAEVEDGVVTLEGMVDSVYQRRRAVELASYSIGVKRVVSRLRVDWDTPEAYRTSE